MLDYKSYEPIAIHAAKQMKARLSDDDKHDVMTAIWESHRRFLIENNAESRELTQDEKTHLRSQLFMRARGAVIDVIRFNTWSVSRELSNGVKSPKLIYEPVQSKQSFFDQFQEPLSIEDILEKKMELERHKKFDIIVEFLKGSTMKEIGIKRGVSEARINQIFKEYIR